MLSFTIHARWPIVDDEFFSTVPGSNFTLCMVSEVLGKCN